MQLDDVARDGQAQPEARPLRRTVSLSQTLEHIREKRGLDPFSLISDRDAQLPVFLHQLQIDLFARRRELDRVRQDVPDHLLEPRGIGGHQTVDRLDL